MGFFSDLLELEIEGVKIRLEARAGLLANEYSLIVDGIKQDQVKGFLGKFYLHGRLKEDKESSFTVIIKQCFGTRYSVQYDGQENIPKRIH